MAVDDVFRIADEGKCLQTKVVEFDKTARFDDVHGVLNGCLHLSVGIGDCKNRSPVRQCRKSDDHTRCVKSSVSDTSFKFHGQLKKLCESWIVPVRNQLPTVRHFFRRRIEAVLEFCFGAVRYTFFQHVDV